MSDNLTPAQRSMRASTAALTRWAFEEDRAAATRPGTDAFLRKFEREVDPDGTLPVDERLRRAIALRKAHMRRLSLASSKAKARRRGAA